MMFYIGMLYEDVWEEYKCLLGDPTTLCRQPDIAVFKSGHHDIYHIPESLVALPIIMTLLREAKDRGTKIFWLSTTSFHRSHILDELNRAARRLCTEYGIQYIDTDIIARKYNHTKGLRGHPFTNMIYKEYTSHIGSIRFKRKHELMLSSYMTQNLLHHLC